MKKYIINLMLSSAIALTALTACTQEESNLLPNDETTSEQTEKTKREHAEGYFTATFFPQTVDGTDTRAAIDGYSNRIQSLVCLIYQRQENEDGNDEDAQYTFYTEEQIISYDGSTQSYHWPYKEVSFKLPNGDYKAVFVANTDSRLFQYQNSSRKLLENYQGKFEDVRINMPEDIMGRPINFDDENMFYLCMVDFSEKNFDGSEEPPYVLLQRLVVKNVYGHDLIDTHELATKLIDTIVAQISKGHFLSDLVEDLLSTKLLNVVEDIVYGIFDEGVLGAANKLLLAPTLKLLIDGIVQGLLIDDVLDPIVTQLTARILEKLNDQLLHPVLSSVESTLVGADGSLLNVNGVLNPWGHVEFVDVKFKSLPKSINLNREVTDKYEFEDDEEDKQNDEKVITFNDVEVKTNENGLKDAIVYTLPGDLKLYAIDVQPDRNPGLLELVGDIVDKVDDDLLNGLLINMHIKLQYPMTSNLMYTTRSALLDVTLHQEDPELWDGETVVIRVPVGDILQDSPIQTILEALLKGPIVGPLLETLSGLLKTIDFTGLLGVRNLVDNLLVALVGDSSGTGGLVDSLVEELSKGIGITLPSLNINTISIGGQWGQTRVSNGDIISDNVPPKQ